MAATRLPGKPLADIAGEPMIVHVLRRAPGRRRRRGRGRDRFRGRSLACVEKAGGRAVMTRADHASGSDRIFEALQASIRKAARSIIVNVQGDLPTLAPTDIRAALAPLADPAVDIATLAAEITRAGRAHQSQCGEGRRHAGRRPAACARSISPAPPRPAGEGPLYHHIGLYAYRRAALARFVALPPSPLEQRERLEQLRALEAGMRIDVALVDSVPLGVDTPDDLTRARILLARR